MKECLRKAYVGNRIIEIKHSNRKTLLKVLNIFVACKCIKLKYLQFYPPHLFLNRIGQMAK